jgi:hypothetical protein
MITQTSSRTDADQNPAKPTPAQSREWPAKSEPGHIRPIGPAYRRSAEEKPATTGSGSENQDEDREG